MSELKVYEFDTDYPNDIQSGSYYDKSEADKVIVRNKYKRCLAMARWCRTSARCDEGLGAFKYRDWYWKWFKRWIAIAEQFKEAK